MRVVRIHFVLWLLVGVAGARGEAPDTACVACHGESDSHSMHSSGAVKVSCVDCHGGTASVFVPAGTSRGAAAYEQAKQQAHVQPRFPHERIVLRRAFD